MRRLAVQIPLFLVFILCLVVPYYYLSYVPGQVERYQDLIVHLERKAVREANEYSTRMQQYQEQRAAYAGQPEAQETLDKAQRDTVKRAVYFSQEIPSARSNFEDILLELGSGIPQQSVAYREAIVSLRSARNKMADQPRP